MPTNNFNLDFIVIGCRKTASTWLYENLLTHSQICLSTKVKESYFFSRYFHRGLAWYKTIFNDCNEGTLRGEIDASVINHPGSAANLKELFPNIRIIVVFRNPADLFFSSYIHAHRKGDVSGPPDDVWQNNVSFRQEVSFSKLLEPFFSIFPIEQFLFLTYEDMQKNPKSYLEKIFRFLKIPSEIDPEKVVAKINTARMSRFPLASKVFSSLARAARTGNLHWLVNGVKKLGILKLTEKTLPKKQGPAMSESLKNIILKDCSSGLSELEKISKIPVKKLWLDKH